MADPDQFGTLSSQGKPYTAPATRGRPLALPPNGTIETLNGGVSRISNKDNAFAPSPAPLASGKRALRNTGLVKSSIVANTQAPLAPSKRVSGRAGPGKPIAKPPIEVETPNVEQAEDFDYTADTAATSTTVSDNDSATKHLSAKVKAQLQTTLAAEDAKYTKHVENLPDSLQGFDLEMHVKWLQDGLKMRKSDIRAKYGVGHRNTDKTDIRGDSVVKIWDGKGFVAKNDAKNDEDAADAKPTTSMCTGGTQTALTGDIDARTNIRDMWAMLREASEAMDQTQTARAEAAAEKKKVEEGQQLKNAIVFDARFLSTHEPFLKLKDIERFSAALAGSFKMACDYLGMHQGGVYWVMTAPVDDKERTEKRTEWIHGLKMGNAWSEEAVKRERWVRDRLFQYWHAQGEWKGELADDVNPLKPLSKRHTTRAGEGSRRR